MNDFDEKFYEEERSPFPRWIVWWAVALIVVLLIFWWFWPTISRAVITNDLRHYSTVVRQSDVDVEIKVQLLNQIDDLEGKIQQGHSIGLFRWRSTDAAIRELLTGELSSEDVLLIQRELERRAK